MISSHCAVQVLLEVLQGTVAALILCCGNAECAGKFEQRMDVGEYI